jgi:tetratricopeptide (TPR) repeat protein
LNFSFKNIREGKMERKTIAFLLSMNFLVTFAFSGCGNSNLFSFGHSAGADTSTTSLSADANAALQSGDYAKALEYYKKILESDPSNSEAIYGFCTSDLANAGLDLPSLISTFIKESNVSSAPSIVRRAPSASEPKSIGQAIAIMAQTGPIFSSQASLLPDSIKLKILTLGPVVDEVLGEKYLKKIIKGQGDGVIAPDNADLNINIAFCLVLRAAITAYNSGVDFQDNYTQSSLVDSPALQSAAKDLISAYQRLKIVINALNLGNNAAISKIKDDIQKLYDSLPAATQALFDLNYDYYLNS